MELKQTVFLLDSLSLISNSMFVFFNIIFDLSKLHFKCRRVEDTMRWKELIEASANGKGRIFIDPHPFGSSFPVRSNSYAQWLDLYYKYLFPILRFVDGSSFMSRAADMMELAREEIFITDWWLSPEIYMKRPALQGTRWRLDQILLRKAQQGVRIFVLLYKVSCP